MNPTSLGELAFQLHVSGFCVLDNVIPADRRDDIRDSVIETVIGQHSNYETGRSAAERKVGFTPSIINYNQSFAEHLSDERLLTLVRRLLGKHLRISFTSAIINQPGNLRGNWHAD